MSNDDRNVGVVISDIARLMRTEFDRRAKRLGLTRPQWLLLSRLHRHPGLSQSELATMLEVEKATAGRMIDRLEANGWVKRRSEPGDRRVKRVYLTAEAEREHKRMWPVAEATVDDALFDLSAQDSKKLYDLLLRVKKTLVAMVEDSPPRKSAAAQAARRQKQPNGRVSA
jgi:MarR family transcriptional regulator, transcriptional regulator for hemolysin